MPAELNNGTDREAVDWNTIIRNSFIFSQGLFTLQTPITRWLAMGPLYDTYINHETRSSVKESTSKYSKAITEHSLHAATTLEGKIITSHASEADKVLANLQYELDAAFTFSPEERVRQKEITLIRIAEGLINRDRTYLLERDGRPVGENGNRDKWSSFIIDFGVFHKGDGFYTWRGTTPAFQQLWDEVLPVIQNRYSEELKAIADKYIAMHPSLSPAEKLRLDQMVNTGM